MLQQSVKYGIEVILNSVNIFSSEPLEYFAMGRIPMARGGNAYGRNAAPRDGNAG